MEQTILLINRERRAVLLTRQFRFPAYVNGSVDGMLVEACAGLLDHNSPEEAIRREAGANFLMQAVPIDQIEPRLQCLTPWLFGS